MRKKDAQEDENGINYKTPSKEVFDCKMLTSDKKQPRTSDPSKAANLIFVHRRQDKALAMKEVCLAGGTSKTLSFWALAWTLMTMKRLNPMGET